MERCGVAPLRPRERIIKTARDLFRKHGIRGIGVDAIAEAAGTNKMTLYRHFGSKDDLIVACLRDVASEVDAIWNDFEQRVSRRSAGAASCLGSRRRRVRRSTMAAAATWPMPRSNSPKAIIRRGMSSRNSRRRSAIAWRNSAATPELRKADLLADTLSLLLEGARVSRQSVGVEGPSAHFIAIGEAVIAAFARETEDRRPRRYAAGEATVARSPRPTAPGGMALKRAR